MGYAATKDFQTRRSDDHIQALSVPPSLAVVGLAVVCFPSFLRVLTCFSCFSFAHRSGLMMPFVSCGFAVQYDSPKTAAEEKRVDCVCEEDIDGDGMDSEGEGWEC